MPTSATTWLRPTRTAVSASGTLGTSVLFLGTILAVVVYLTVTDADRTERVRIAGEARDQVRSGSEDRR